MQYVTSQEQSTPNEIAMLGERYQLGTPKGAYYVSYTRADIRRYRITYVYMCYAILYFIWALVSLVLLIVNWPGKTSVSVPLMSMLNMFMLFYVLAMRRKWGNRPVINVETRHERVYIYQNGLIKQTNKHCHVVRWPEVINVKYIPSISDFQDPKFRSFNIAPGNAGLQITCHGGKKISLSGALYNLDGLASYLNYYVNVIM